MSVKNHVSPKEDNRGSNAIERSCHEGSASESAPVIDPPPDCIPGSDASEARAKRAADEAERAIKKTAQATVWMAVATILLFLANLGAICVSLQQVLITGDQEHRQLRAYILPFDAKIVVNQTTRQAVASIAIKNFGQTPAYDFRVWSFLFVKPFSVGTVAMPVNPFTSYMRDYAGVLAPGTGISKSSSLADSDGHTRPLTEQELNGINTNESVIYALGEITYTDTFGRTHETDIRFFANRKFGLPTGMMWYGPGEKSN